MTCSGLRYTTSAKGTNGRWDTGRRRRLPKNPSAPPYPTPTPLRPPLPPCITSRENQPAPNQILNAIRHAQTINRENRRIGTCIYLRQEVHAALFLNCCSRRQVEAGPTLSYPMSGIQNSCIRRCQGKTYLVYFCVILCFYFGPAFFVLLSFLTVLFFLLVQSVVTSMPLRIQQFFLLFLKSNF
ncbi:hypothetical protein SKAU_G00389670 [Synaphobranchus kaupii]|uniref:Uncharacterized protein n=1 Tax=Synaphobranchus kaupii TaxID=118154 RepID=A0A9Q1ICN2_SYNKA|nr:hypothetical protein SKAU_G00389670 [Synaphobranchus kaupii]